MSAQYPDPDDLFPPMPEPATDEEDLWFLPGPPDDDEGAPPAPGVSDWLRAESGQAARLARVAGRLGALDDRLLRGPAGWRQRLALSEAVEIGWHSGNRVSEDRLGLWILARSGADTDAVAYQRAAWAFRRLSGGPGPGADLAAFLGRHGSDDLAETLVEWQAAALAPTLHPLTRACRAYHLWPLAGVGPAGDRLEGGVIAARMAAAELSGGALFVPLAMGGAESLRPGGEPEAQLARWLGGIEQAVLRAMRLLDTLSDWRQRAEATTGPLSGRTPPRLITAFCDWPLLSAPMAEEITGASRAAVQRNLDWFAAAGLVREVTGQGRFRVWTIC